MRCERCQGCVRVLQTFAAGPGGKTSAAVCESCGRRYTIISVALDGEIQGARNLASQLKRGEVVDRSNGRYAVKITPAQFAADF